MELEPVNTVADMLRNVQKHFPNPKALNYYYQEEWHSLSTDSYLEQVKYLALALHNMGIKKGDCIGLLAPPSPRWVIVDLSIILAGAISVPLFANISEENFVYEIEETQLKVIFVAEKDPWAICKKYKEHFHVIVDMDEQHAELLGVSYVSLIEKGKAIDLQHPNLYKELQEALNIDDTATIIYTSGSTGTPKGAEITHRGFVSSIYFKAFEWHSKTDRYLNALPLAHVFGRMLNLVMLAWGISIYYYNDIKTFGNAALQVHPTILVLVPRILEKIYAKILSGVHQLSGIRRELAEWALNLAHIEQKNWYQTLLNPIADLLVYRKFREALGGSVRILISGGASLNIHLLRFFLNVGIPIYEGWGLTEAATVTVNRPGKMKLGTVGAPLADLQVCISPEGEVLVKGFLVMKGYYKNPEITAKAIDKNGWLHTGDKGVIDKDGFLTLIGRLKEVYKTSTGEYVVPIPIEQALTRSPYIDMALVVADKRKFTSCLLFPDIDLLHKLKKKQNQEALTDEEFLNSPLIKQEIVEFIERINNHLNHWEQIHEYRFILTPLSIEAGDLTPSMKIKREFVANKYNDVIDSMYQEGN